MKFRLDKHEPRFQRQGGAGARDQKRRGENPFLTFIKLALIFSLVRIVMLVLGKAFVYIPYVDPLLIRVARVLAKLTSFAESFWRSF